MNLESDEISSLLGNFLNIVSLICHVSMYAGS